jgi:hypothetical protein
MLAGMTWYPLVLGSGLYMFIKATHCIIFIVPKFLEVPNSDDII